jgi:1-acyl-sn-glycerol-3-phosphate acyltransferase
MPEALMSSSLEISTNTVPATRAPLTLLGWCRLVCVLAAVFAVMTLATLVMLLAGLFTMFLTRRFYTEVLARSLGRIVLCLCGVRLMVHHEGPLSAGQVVYISNHTSTLDCFVLIALGLPNTRFFLSGFLRKNPLICIMGYLTGTIWTVPQTRPEKRRQIFQRAERILHRSGESVYLSPEGERVRTGEIAHFNKGAFHLATNLRAPLVPFYIAIPPETDPGLGLDVRPGTVHVYFQPPIPTDDWRLEDLERNRTCVRDFFVRLHEQRRLITR